uniref:Uncharacterized protein n=1 Tax=Arundo donax TaxID=35708 RepID=A0A0A9KI32_ARUDO
MKSIWHVWLALGSAQILALLGKLARLGKVFLAHAGEPIWLSCSSKVSLALRLSPSRLPHALCASDPHFKDQLLAFYSQIEHVASQIKLVGAQIILFPPSNQPHLPLQIELLPPNQPVSRFEIELLTPNQPSPPPKSILFLSKSSSSPLNRPHHSLNRARRSLIDSPAGGLSSSVHNFAIWKEK